MTTSRRQFLKASLASVGGLCLGCPMLTPPQVMADDMFRDDDDSRFVKEAMFYKKLENLKTQCELCPRKCSVADLERGYCGVRENRGGTYYTLVHSRPCTLHVDPIEKKPLFHYLPASRAFSLATAGCNVECKFCQNWQISQFRPEQVRSYYLPPDELAEVADEKNCETIAYTYSEPVIFYEYMYDIARAASKRSVGSVMISNGYINKEPLIKLCKELTGVKIDFKAFSEKFYKEYCSGKLQPVLDTLTTLKEIGIWFEMVVLVIPSLNDNEEETKAMCKWVMENLGPDVPMHFTRFHGAYKLKNLPDTPVRALERARAIAADAGIHFAYVGNVVGHKWENTYCPHCGEVVVRRIGYRILKNNIKNGACGECKKTIPGVWDKSQVWKNRT